MSQSITDEIFLAMENGELQAYYQPQYDARKGVIGGAEALVRWVKKDGTVIPPMEFIPELESNGKVTLVDWYIAEAACKTLRKLGDKAVKISVNFSRKHASDVNFVKRLERLVAAYGIDKRLFGVEITETDVVVDKQLVVQWIEDVEKAGFPVAIDDFGTGMSSLSLMKDIPAHIIKIDRSFLNDNCQSEKGRVTLESVFYFAHRLKLDTVVEGVETPEQLHFLHACDCDLIQGFLFSRPIPESAFLTMCIEEAPVDVKTGNPLEFKSGFGTLRLLVESVYRKYPLIVYVNLSKNSYYTMRKENFINDSLSATGTYDEGYCYVKKLIAKEYHEILDEAFLRENLLKAHANGEEKVIRMVPQHHSDGRKVLMCIEDYFMTSEVSKDVFMVCFFQEIDAEEYEVNAVKERKEV